MYLIETTVGLINIGLFLSLMFYWVCDCITPKRHMGKTPIDIGLEEARRIKRTVAEEDYYETTR